MFSLLCFAFVVFFSSASSAVDITKMLSSNPNFSQFSTLLTQTKVAEQINSRQTITVLALSNTAVGSIAGKPQDILKKILSVHVVLDYYDIEKLTKLAVTNKSGPALTTLFQASGQALDQEGFLTVYVLNEGEVTLGSSVKGAPLDSMLVKSVATQPTNIAVIQISKPIEVPGIETPNPNAPKDNNANAKPKVGDAATAHPQASGASAPNKAPQAAAPTKAQAQAPSKKMGAPTPGVGAQPQNPAAAAASAPTHNPAAAPTQKPQAASPIPTKKDPAASAPTQKEPAAAAPTQTEDSTAAAPTTAQNSTSAPVPTQKDSAAAAPSQKDSATTPAQSPVGDQTPAAATPATSTTPIAATPAASSSKDDGTPPFSTPAPKQKVAIGFVFLMALVSFVGF